MWYRLTSMICQPSDATGRRRTGAFTLMEMLVVISIITLLLALLSPSIGKVKENAIRTKCASRLRQLHIASTTYADDYAGLFPYRTPSTFMPHVMKASGFDLNDGFIWPYMGVRDPETFCPGPLYKVRNPRVYAAYISTHITYQYHNYNGGGWAVTKPDLRRNTSSGAYALWSCLTTLKNTGNWLAHDSPETPVEPTGQNAALLDGSAHWFTWDDMEMYAFVSSHEFYWPIPQR